MRIKYDLEHGNLNTVGLVTYTPRPRRFMPLILLEIFAFVAIFLLVLKFHPTEDFRDVNISLKYVQRVDSRQFAAMFEDKTTENSDVTEDSDLNSDLVDTVSPKMEGSPNLWEQPSLLNLTNFKWLVNNESRCQQTGTNPKRLVPVLVHTARTHFEDRKIIRDSWASIQNLYQDWDVRPVFLLGQPDPQSNFVEIQKNGLFAEQQLYGDIVIGNFEDTYKNLSYKHLMGYKWILNFCKNAEFVIKTDDDIFLDIFNWLDWRRQDLQKSILQDAPNLLPDLYCIVYNNTKPARDPKNKYFVPYGTFQEEYYPDYCSGHAYGITVEAIRKIYSVSKVRKFLWVDDAYVTGVLRKQAEGKYGWKPVLRNIWPHVSHELKAWVKLCEREGKGLNKWKGKRMFKSVVNVPPYEFKQRDMNCLWRKVLFDRYIDKIIDNLSMQGIAAMFRGNVRLQD